ncbi:MAG: serine hydrolase [Saprospiraceae bacterium]|nr:serine hydrolase [Saprospiraceae bacterium]
MMKLLLPFFLFFLLSVSISAQSEYYFPPLSGSDWESKSPADLGWCPEKLDSLHAFLEEKQTRSFIVLHEGRIVLEYYFGNASETSFWYLASAGKSVMGFMIGMAQEQGLLDIEDPTSTYLGAGWTDCPPEKEELITVWNQITMTSGLDDEVEIPGVLDPSNCLDPECLVYLADAGTRWAYHNAPYRLTQDLLAEVSGNTINQVTAGFLNQRIGSALFWLDHVCWGKARDAARFGLLTLNRGVWDTDTLMYDQNYFDQMTNTSQSLNKSYGYLWWLNGKESFMLPGLQLVFPGPIFPDAPEDLFAALGLNDQKIYVVPSMDMVVIRQGDSAGDPVAAASSFDNQLWIKLLDLSCTTVSAVEEFKKAEIQVSPQPADASVEIRWPGLSDVNQYQLFDRQGRLMASGQINAFAQQLTLDSASYPAGVYILQLIGSQSTFTQKVLISR